MKPKHRHLHFISSLKIQKQLYLVFTLAVAAPILALGSFITYQSVRLFYERAYEQLESDNLRARSILFDPHLLQYLGRYRKKPRAETDFTGSIPNPWGSSGSLPEI